jgi:hypothetical protein
MIIPSGRGFSQALWQFAKSERYTFSGRQRASCLHEERDPLYLDLTERYTLAYPILKISVRLKKGASSYDDQIVVVMNANASDAILVSFIFFSQCMLVCFFCLVLYISILSQRMQYYFANCSFYFKLISFSYL